MEKKDKLCSGGGVFKKVKKFVIWMLVFLLIVGCISSITNNNKKSGNKGNGSESNTTADNNKVYAVGEVVSTSDVKISFLSASEYIESNEFLQPKAGMMYYRAEFEFENIGDSDKSLSSLLSWECYADDYAMSQSYVGDDGLDGTISKGRKLKGALYYEVPKDAKEIILEYKDNLLVDEKIVFKVK